VSVGVKARAFLVVLRSVRSGSTWRRDRAFKSGRVRAG
jgi:hypothetical protein